MKLCYFVGMFLLCVQTVSELLKQVRGIAETGRARKAPPAEREEAAE